MTAVTSLTSKPRAATSVATSTGTRPSRNCLRTKSRDACVLSPCNEAERKAPVWLRRVDSISQRLLVPQKMMNLDPGGLVEMYDEICENLSRLLATTMTICLMVLAATSLSCTSPIKTAAGLLRTRACAVLCTEVGHVAEKKAVWRSAGRLRTMSLMSCSNPMSNMRSASSKTRYLVAERLISPDSTKSIRRPGVAITTWGRRWRLRPCSERLAPPYTQAERMPRGRPNLMVSFWICWANSRVGARMSIEGPS
mmetsp:Transcript_24136/g.43179  ORF Transcript_24136/g.43179 Transcript_24136/m.43179 type:complete len:253 (+) Transcript_24136:816-1574(+)